MRAMPFVLAAVLVLAASTAVAQNETTDSPTPPTGMVIEGSISLNPDPPVEGKDLRVTAHLPNASTDRVMLNVCAFDRAAGHATTCLIPVPMESKGDGVYVGNAPESAQDMFRAGDTLGVNLSFNDAELGWTGYPSNAYGYALYDVVQNDNLEYTVKRLIETPGPGALAALLVLGAVAVAWTRPGKAS